MDRHPDRPGDGETPWYSADDRYAQQNWTPAPGGPAPYDDPENSGRFGTAQPGGFGSDQSPAGAQVDPLTGRLDQFGASRGDAVGGSSYGSPRPDVASGQPYGSPRPDAASGPPYGSPRPDAASGPPYGSPRPDAASGPPYGAPRPDAAAMSGYGAPLSSQSGPGPVDPGGSPDGQDPMRLHHTQPLDRAALRRPEAATGGPAGPEKPGSVYRTKRPAAAVVIIVALVVCELVALRVFATGLFGGTFNAGATIAGMFLLSGLPLTAIGLYAVVTGAASAGAGAQPWLRPPLAYLWVGIALLLAAGAAA